MNASVTLSDAATPVAGRDRGLHLAHGPGAVRLHAVRARPPRRRSRSAAPPGAGSSRGGVGVAAARRAAAAAAAGSRGRRPLPAERAIASAAVSAARAHAASESAIGLVRGRAAHVAVAQHHDLHAQVVDRGGLGGARAGVAQHQRALAGHEGERAVARRRRLERALGELEAARHATPTCTSRKRAGRGAVRDVHRLPGLALAAVEHAPEPPGRRAEQTASRLAQNSGVTPA